MKEIGMNDVPLESLEVLLGTWQITGDATGLVKYRRMDGGYFLTQEVSLEYGGRKIEGIEWIGRLHPVDGQPSTDIHSRFYSTLDGLTLDYVYEIRGNDWTIWFGPKGSDNAMTSKFSRDRRSYSGSWRWPGGGYSFVGTRLD